MTQTQSRLGQCRPALLGLLFCSALSSQPAAVLGADLNLVLAAVTTGEGTLRVAIYASEQAFRKDAMRNESVPAVTGDTQITVQDLPPGDYAVLAYQDMNDNGDLDTNLLGLPTEPWGGSLNDGYTFGSPTWRDTRFALPTTGVAVTIDMSGSGMGASK